jgi:glycosyltransferase involved in cell wall biosynthesis
MRKILIVSTLDYGYYDNNRVHHIVEHFQYWFDNVYLMFTKVYLPGRISLVSQILGFISIKTRSFQSGSASCIEVDPLLNRVGGLALSLLKVEDPYAAPSFRVKGLLRRILSPMGFLTELGILPSLLIAYGLRVRERVDIVVGQGPWEVAFCLVLKKCGLAKMVVYDDFDYAPGIIPVDGIRRKLIAKLEKICLRNSDLIISVGELLGELREQQIGKKVNVIPNGVDYELFRSAQEKISHPPTIVYIGYVYGWAGLEIIFQSLLQVRKDIPSIRFLIAGHSTPEYLRKLLKLKGELGLEECVQYLGKLSYSDLVPNLRESDIGMALFRPIPLRKYAFPLKVVEYFAAGLPVITTKGLQAARVVEDAGAGLAVEYSETAVAEAIIEMLNNGERYRNYSGNAVTAARDYDWSDLMRKAYVAIDTCYRQQGFAQSAA